MTDRRGHPDRPGGAAPEPNTGDPPAGPAVAPLPVALSDITFLHWHYPPEVVRPLLPCGTRPDTFDGVAYVGLVALRMRSYGEFLQVNVRTYSVDRHGRRGVVFSPWRRTDCRGCWPAVPRACPTGGRARA